jgi:hypothetical protein
MVVVGLLIAAACIVGLSLNFRRRLDQATSASDGADREQAEALRQISRDIHKGNTAGRWYF